MRPTLPILALMLALAQVPTAHARMPTRHTLTRHRLTLPPAENYTAETTYLTPIAGTPLARLSDRILAAWARKNHRQFVEGARSAQPPDDSSRAYFYQAAPFHTRYIAPRLFSVGMEEDWYQGGAHPSTWDTAFNFGLVGGRPKRLGLADFFPPRSGYHKRVQTLLLAKLRGDEAASDINKIQALSPEQLNQFLVERDGLRFFLNAHEVSVYAGPPVELKLTAQELGPRFRRGLTR